MRSRDVANTVVVLALSVRAALAGRVIGAGPVQVAVAPATLVTVKVIATLRIVRTAQGAVDGAGPVADRTHGVLEPHVEGESTVQHTEGPSLDREHTRTDRSQSRYTPRTCCSLEPQGAQLRMINNIPTYCWSARCT